MKWLKFNTILRYLTFHISLETLCNITCKNMICWHTLQQRCTHNGAIRIFLLLLLLLLSIDAPPNEHKTRQCLLLRIQSKITGNILTNDHCLSWNFNSQVTSLITKNKAQFNNWQRLKRPKFRIHTGGLSAGPWADNFAMIFCFHF